MAIQVSGVNVIDNDRNTNTGVLTATRISTSPEPIVFSPVNGATGVDVGDNIVLQYNGNIETTGIGSINFREGSASGAIATFIKTNGYGGYISASNSQFTINPIGNLPTGKNLYVTIDEGYLRSKNFTGDVGLLNTYNFTTGGSQLSSKSPSDGADLQSVSTNITLTFEDNIAKGTGNITIRSGSASGTIQQTIDVTSGAVSISNNQATINPPSDLEYATDTYIVVDAGCFTNTDGDAASGTALINDYNFTTEPDAPPLGGAHEGGYLICCTSRNFWIVAPSSTEVCRTWYQRNHASTSANNNAACGDWFVPSCGQLQNPGFYRRSYWDAYKGTHPCRYWSNTECHTGTAWNIRFDESSNYGLSHRNNKTASRNVRAFRCVAY